MKRKYEAPSGFHDEIRMRVHRLICHGSFAADMSFTPLGHESLTKLVADLIYSMIGLTCMLLDLYEEWVKDRRIEPDLFSLIDLADMMAQVS